ncbi:hypothetical protein SeMB42_g00040 [Synchytrium endobioticum]|uniref:CRAL-TRIO domain-containing protein n=1 Tax=Synchytrium endobioticum TaxID=286115 RepID=A0A507DTD1_9FUNG|nr:hypothetical protein SeLEV6574_g02701 [Synchytrium endobioticum]TPX55009.1 hypothetical protein SeMB42_g00040 [Synchytrium endobioticum]
MTEPAPIRLMASMPVPGVPTKLPVLSCPDVILKRLDSSAGDPDLKKKLSPEQLATLHEFRLLISSHFTKVGDKTDPAPADSEIADVRQDEESWCDDACLLRYLRASNWKVSHAAERLEATLKWRRSYKPHKITPDDVKTESLTGKIYVNGFDIIGRPILYLCPKRENTKDYDQQLKHTVFVLETAIKMMPVGVEQMVIIIDYEDVSMRTSPPLSISRRFLEVLGNHYPERFGIGFVVNPSWYLWVALTIVSPFLDPVSKAKLNFVSLDNKVKKKESTNDGTGTWTSLQKYIDNEMLDAMFGGAYMFEWDHPTYWSHICALRNVRKRKIMM